MPSKKKKKRGGRLCISFDRDSTTSTPSVQSRTVGLEPGCTFKPPGSFRNYSGTSLVSQLGHHAPNAWGLISIPMPQPGTGMAK